MGTREVFGLVSLHINKDGHKCLTDSVSGIVTDLSFHKDWIEDAYDEFAPRKSKQKIERTVKGVLIPLVTEDTVAPVVSAENEPGVKDSEETKKSVKYPL